ncbi:MAG: hypothetical protein ACI4WM_07740 [Erysipelotrichaceae bacterium]
MAITVNIYYTEQNGSAKNFVDEMIKKRYSTENKRRKGQSQV